MELGGLRGLLASWREGRDEGLPAVLAVVTRTTGSTYTKGGAMALVDGAGHRFGALSGGCLEPELERRARLVLESGRAARGDFDTEVDGDRVFGSGLGCRGHLETLLLPVPSDSTDHLLIALERAFADAGTLRVTLSLDPASLGSGAAESGGWRSAWGPGGHAADAERPAASGEAATLTILPPRALLLLGAGPETSLLVSFARQLGWTTTVVEPRRRWADPARAAGADDVRELTPAEADAALSPRRFDAVLVMSHSFETDLEHLRHGLAARADYVGLLGPPGRRDELLRELGGRAEDLGARLHAPVGLPLGGHGAEAIALAIAAQLLQRFESRDAGNR